MKRPRTKTPRQEHAQVLSLVLSAFRAENSSLWTVLGLVGCLAELSTEELQPVAADSRKWTGAGRAAAEA